MVPEASGCSWQCGMGAASPLQGSFQAATYGLALKTVKCYSGLTGGSYKKALGFLPPESDGAGASLTHATSPGPSARNDKCAGTEAGPRRFGRRPRTALACPKRSGRQMAEVPSW